MITAVWPRVLVQTGTDWTGKNTRKAGNGPRPLVVARPRGSRRLAWLAFHAAGPVKPDAVKTRVLGRERVRDHDDILAPLRGLGTPRAALLGRKRVRVCAFRYVRLGQPELLRDCRKRSLGHHGAVASQRLARHSADCGRLPFRVRPRARG